MAGNPSTRTLEWLFQGPQQFAATSAGHAACRAADSTVLLLTLVGWTSWQEDMQV
jgi:hypothetical protein